MLVLLNYGGASLLIIENSGNGHLKKSDLFRKHPLSLEKLRSSLLEKAWDENRSHLHRKKVTYKEFAKITMSSTAKLPSIDCFQKATESFLEKVVLNSDRSLRKSDTGDLAHSMYLPYVDIFRADKFMTNLLSPISKEYGTTVFPTLPLLLDYLEGLP